MSPRASAPADRATVPSAHRRPSRRVVALSVPIVLAVVAIGVWVTGALLTDDARLAMVLTGAWFAVAGLLAALVALRWRVIAVPVLATYVLGSVALGGFLLYTSSVDRVVHEDVVVAAAAPRPLKAEGAQPSAVAPQRPVAVAAGRFRSGAHRTAGTATLIQQSGGHRVLTLTGFATEPGPDLRVYLVPASGNGVRGAVDLGRLKGNKGDQQYAVADGARAGAVVIWCRSFSVAFGSATLA